MSDLRALSPSLYHETCLLAVKPRFAFPGQVSIEWRNALSLAFEGVLGWDRFKLHGPLNIAVLEVEETDEYTRKKLVFESEPGADVPCHLLIPKGCQAPVPAFICLQGHSTGMHISLGKAVYEGDEALLGGDRDFAIQAVRQGYVALAMEQRAFGERSEKLQQQRAGNGCEDAAMHALLLGHTLAAERAWDVSRAIDLLETIPEVQSERICCMGNSGGGTATFNAACVDPRIYLAMPSCSFCTYKDSIFRIYHCPDNFIPGILKIADQGDLTALIAPRRLIVVNGLTDEIFPIKGVREAYAVAESVYAAYGVSERVRHIEGDGGHRFYADLAWPVVREMLVRE